MLEPLVEFQLQQGIHGFDVGGSTGEAFVQSRAAERAAVLRELARVVRGRARLIAHVGAIATDEAIGLARVAADAGYDAISAIPPFYYDFSPSEVHAHYLALAEATPPPLDRLQLSGQVGPSFEHQRSAEAVGASQHHRYQTHLTKPVPA
jgi:N-acetylneuraminate lyase